MKGSKYGNRKICIVHRKAWASVGTRWPAEVLHADDDGTCQRKIAEGHYVLLEMHKAANG